MISHDIKENRTGTKGSECTRKELWYSGVQFS